MNPKSIVTRFLFLGVILMVVSLIFQISMNSQIYEQSLAYSDLLKEVEAANIKKVVFYSDGIVKGELKSAPDGNINFKSNVGEGDTAFLSRKLESQDPSPEILKKPAEMSFWVGLAGWIPILLMVGIFLYFLRSMNAGGTKGGPMGFLNSKAKLSENKTPASFKDVAGADEGKEELKEIVDFLGDPRKYTALGGHIPKGVLLVGPPGVGKTLLARSVAGEAHVPFFSITGSDFVEMFVGVGAARVRDLFDQGKKKAPCIIFIDELDAVGRHRGAGMGGGHDEREQTLNALLVEMDGFEPNNGVVVMAATNRPDVLDPALLRPGRFDRQVVIGKPDIKGRYEILQIHSTKIPLAEDVDLESIAKGTPGSTGADLANLCNEAALSAGRNNKKIVAMEDFEFAKDKILMGGERSTIISPKEKEITAFHEAGHAIVASMLPEADPVHKVTIIPRGLSMGSTWQLPDGDRHNYSRTFLKSQLAILMAGRCAEEIAFGEWTTGASNDIERATDISREMVCSWGMSKKIGPLKCGAKGESPFLGKQMTEVASNYSEATAQQIDAEIKEFIAEAEKRATQILTERKLILEAMAKALMERETMTGDEVRKMLVP